MTDFKIACPVCGWNRDEETGKHRMRPQAVRHLRSRTLAGASRRAAVECGSVHPGEVDRSRRPLADERSINSRSL